MGLLYTGDGGFIGPSSWIRPVIVWVCYTQELGGLKHHFVGLDQPLYRSVAHRKWRVCRTICLD